MKLPMVFQVDPDELGADEIHAKALFERIARDCSPLTHTPFLDVGGPVDAADPTVVAFWQMWDDYHMEECALECAAQEAD